MRFGDSAEGLARVRAECHPPGVSRSARRIDAPWLVTAPSTPPSRFPELEQQVLERWRERDVFHESIRRREGAEPFVFYEGPPTANGRPGLAPRPEPRLQGRVPALQDDARPLRARARRGWDCHGLPVELEVEKELGFTDEGRHRALRRGRVQRQVPRVGAALHRRVERADRADRLLDRHRRRLLHARQRLHRVGLVVAQAGLGQGPAHRGPQGRARTAPAAAPRCPRTRWRSATRTWSTRRCT